MSHEFSHQPLLPVNQRGQRPKTQSSQLRLMVVILKYVKDYTDRTWFVGSSFFVGQIIHKFHISYTVNHASYPYMVSQITFVL